MQRIEELAKKLEPEVGSFQKAKEVLQNVYYTLLEEGKSNEEQILAALEKEVASRISSNAKKQKMAVMLEDTVGS